MNRILFIRHGSTAGNLERRYIGRTDEPLCPQGVVQIEKLAETKLNADVLFVSPARRTKETAEILFPGMPGTEVPGLWETNFGRFEGKTADELWETEESYRQWVDGNCLGAVPEGESVAQFKDRCCEAFLQCMTQVPDGAAVAFVIHGGCIMGILERFALPKRDFYDYHISNGAYLTCTMENGSLTLQEPVSG